MTGRRRDESPYWNPKTETLPRHRLEQLQLAKLRYVSEWAVAHSPHYRRKFAESGFGPEQLDSLDDLRRIPFLTRAEWMDEQAENPPYGLLPVAGESSAVRLHTTSGTSGRMPLRALDSRKDWAWAAEMWCYGLWAQGVRSSDSAYIGFGYGSFIGFWGLHYALEKLGALVIPGGAQTTEARIRQILDFGVTVLASTPTYALRMSDAAQQLGVDLTTSAVRTIVLSGEPCPPSTRALIERRWAAAAYDTAGMTEISSIFMFECAARFDGAHVIEDHVLGGSTSPDR